jgi:hypothetical protein
VRFPANHGGWYAGKICYLLKFAPVWLQDLDFALASPTGAELGFNEAPKDKPAPRQRYPHLAPQRKSTKNFLAQEKDYYLDTIITIAQ